MYDGEQRISTVNFGNFLPNWKAGVGAHLLGQAVCFLTIKKTSAVPIVSVESETGLLLSVSRCPLPAPATTPQSARGGSRGAGPPSDSTGRGALRPSVLGFGHLLHQGLVTPHAAAGLCTSQPSWQDSAQAGGAQGPVVWRV